jgi:hypothetical protein
MSVSYVIAPSSLWAYEMFSESQRFFQVTPQLHMRAGDAAYIEGGLLVVQAGRLFIEVNMMGASWPGTLWGDPSAQQLSQVETLLFSGLDRFGVHLRPNNPP